MSRIVQPPKFQSSSVLYSWDFTSLLQFSEIIGSAFIDVSVYSGTDPIPYIILSGLPSISGNVVSQLITGGVEGVIYNVDCSAVTSLGQTLIISSYISIIPTLT